MRACISGATTIVFALLAVIVCFLSSPSEAAITIVKKGEPQAAIIVGDNASTIELHAAEEFAKYVKGITDATLMQLTAKQWRRKKKSVTAVLIGKQSTNPLIEQLVKDGEFKLSSTYPGLDGFIIKTVPPKHEMRVSLLVLGGSSSRGVLYAVYHFFEYFCHVGFFWDGDHITFEDYKEELNWAAKHKFNRIMFPVPPGKPPGADDTWLEYRRQVTKKAVDYAREKLGIEVIHNGVPSKETIDFYGTDHIYNLDPFPEAKVGETPKEEKEAFVNFAKDALKRIGEIAPQGIWYPSGWTFFAPRRHKETAKAFFEVIPNDKFYICDIWSDQHPVYQRYDYFHGKTWGFSVLHSFGGNDALFGDLEDLIERAKRVTIDPKAKNCKVFYVNPEVVHYNILYFELAAKLAWEPREIELPDFLRHYTICRYGLQHEHRMSKFINKLVQAVYSSYHDVDADYQRRLKINPASPLEMYSCMKGVNKLRKTLRMALAEKRRLEYRERGLATRLLESSILRIDEDEGDIMFISGDRGLYRRIGCVDAIEVCEFFINRGDAEKKKAGEIVLSASWEDEMVEVVEAYQKEPVRFLRPIETFKRRLRDSPWAPSDVLILKIEGEFLGYLVVQEREPGHGYIFEYAGDRRAVTDAIPTLFDMYDFLDLRFWVPRYDTQLIRILTERGIEHKRRNMPGHTMKIVNLPRLMKRFHFYIEERIGTQKAHSIQFIQDGDDFVIRLGDEKFECSGRKLVPILFGTYDNSEKELMPQTGKIAEVFQALFPIPFPWPGLDSF